MPPKTLTGGLGVGGADGKRTFLGEATIRSFGVI
jgi:hypothetical protein